MIRLLGLCGSLRAASSSAALARTIAARVNGSARMELHRIDDLPHYNADRPDDPAVAALVRAVDEADGVVFVTPEYNYSVPGVLKNAIDWASRPAYRSVFRDKPVFVISVSGGALGGVRAQAHLKYIMNGLLARLFTTEEIVVPHANSKVSDGVFTDAVTLDFAMKSLEAFIADIRGRNRSLPSR